MVLVLYMEIHKGDRIMRKNNKFLRELVQSVDVLNTINGGMSEPTVQHLKLSDHHEIEVRIPGVSQNAIKVEVHNNWLTVFYTMEIKSVGSVLNVPKVVFNKSLPYYIDVKKISASTSDGWLVVHLPFNEMADGYHRKIRIGQ